MSSRNSSNVELGFERRSPSSSIGLPRLSNLTLAGGLNILVFQWTPKTSLLFDTWHLTLPFGPLLCDRLLVPPCLPRSLYPRKGTFTEDAVFLCVTEQSLHMLLDPSGKNRAHTDAQHCWESAGRLFVCGGYDSRVIFDQIFHHEVHALDFGSSLIPTLQELVLSSRTTYINFNGSNPFGKLLAPF